MNDVNAKVCYTWLGPHSKKTYILLSLPFLEAKQKKTTNYSALIARILGVLIALLFSDTEKISLWIEIINQLMEP